MWRNKNTFHSGYEVLSPQKKQQSTIANVNNEVFKNRSERLCHRLKMTRNEVLHRNPRGSFSYYHEDDSPVSVSPFRQSEVYRSPTLHSHQQHPHIFRRSHASQHLLRVPNDPILMCDYHGNAAWTSRVSPQYRSRDRDMLYTENGEYYKYNSKVPVFYAASPIRVSKEEIEHMSDEQLASLVRQQNMQLERVTGVIVQSPSPPPSIPKSLTPPQQSFLEPRTEQRTEQQRTERRTERRTKQHTEQHAERHTEQKQSFPNSPSVAQEPKPPLTQHLLPVPPAPAPPPAPALRTLPTQPASHVLVHSNVDELTQLRSQLAQSLGREEILRSRLNKVVEKTNNINEDDKKFQEAVVECIEDLNTELEMMSEERACFDDYNTDVYNSLMSDVDRLILKARRSDYTAQKADAFHDSVRVPVAPAISLSRGLQPLRTTGMLSLPTSSSMHTTNAHETSYTSPTCSTCTTTTVPSLGIHVPSLGMDHDGNITVALI